MNSTTSGVRRDQSASRDARFLRLPTLSQASSFPPSTEVPAVRTADRRSAKAKRRGTRSSSSTMGRATRPAHRRQAPARSWYGTRTTRGTEPRSKLESATLPGSTFLIIDADGQHRPSDATRLVAGLETFDLVVGARAPGTQANVARRLGNAMLNTIATYLHRAAHPGSHLWISCGPPGRAARVPALAAERLLDADHDDPGVHQGRLQRDVRAHRGAQRGRGNRRSGSVPTGSGSFSSCSK